MGVIGGCEGPGVI